MALFAGNKRKSKPTKVKSQKRKSKFSSEGVETVVEVKTVGDIPPVLQARKLIGDEDMSAAAQTLFKAARDDYTRYFSAKGASNDGNRYFFISELSSFKVKVPEIGYVDNTTIMNSINEVQSDGETLTNRVNSLKKLTSFYLNYYEKARFSIGYRFDGEELVSKFSEIYNYMDIMKLYFSKNMEV